MKRILIPVILLFALSCTKSELDEPRTTDLRIISRVNELDWFWQGSMMYHVDGLVNQSIYMMHKIDNTSAVWFDGPLSIANMTMINKYSYSMSCTAIFEGECNGNINAQVWVFEGTGQLLNDTLHESGTIVWKLYNNNKLVNESTGEWKSVLTNN